jgi:hypothetical protein
MLDRHVSGQVCGKIDPLGSVRRPLSNDTGVANRPTIGGGTQGDLHWPPGHDDLQKEPGRMSELQIIRTPGGEELVVLPRAEYEALLARADNEAADADDVAIYDARKAELAAGAVVLPQEVGAAILRGDTRLKAIRNWRDETQLHLAFKTGFGQGYLSDLESGRRPGTPATIAKLAQALNVPVEWLS